MNTWGDWKNWKLIIKTFVLLQARLFDEPQLASLCLDTIDKSTADAVNAEGFTDIDLGEHTKLLSNALFLSTVAFQSLPVNCLMCLGPLHVCAIDVGSPVFPHADTLCAVLERDTLGIRESRLFGAVVRWADAECHRQQLPLTSENKQKVLGKALSLIRFPLMTVEEFAAGKDKPSRLVAKLVSFLQYVFSALLPEPVLFITDPMTRL